MVTVVVIGVSLVVAGTAGTTNSAPLTLGGILTLSLGVLVVWIGYVMARGIHAHIIIRNAMQAGLPIGGTSNSMALSEHAQDLADAGQQPTMFEESPM